MHFDRRRFLRTLAAGSAACTIPGLFADILKQTVALGDGPFYPDKMPLDTDNDLILINDSVNPSVGDITHLTGRMLSKSGEPIRNAFIEIWQTDTNGSYIHTRGRNQGKLDGNFQGYGRFLTDSKGQYYFRTIKPVEYTLNGTFRCPHIHVAASRSGHRLMATQMLINGHSANERDGLVKRVRERKQALETLLVDFKPLSGSKSEWAANFDIVIGRTLHEMEDGSMGVGLGKPEGRK